MVSKGMKILVCIAIALQFVALFSGIVIVCNPKPTYQILGAPEDVFGITVVPFVTLVSLVIPFLWQGVITAFLFLTRQVSRVGKVVMIITVVMYCIFNIVLNYAYTVENIIAGRYGTYRLAALTIIRSAISQITAPFTSAAFVLVILAAGGYIFKKVAENR